MLKMIFLKHKQAKLGDKNHKIIGARLGNTQLHNNNRGAGVCDHVTWVWHGCMTCQSWVMGNAVQGHNHNVRIFLSKLTYSRWKDRKRLLSFIRQIRTIFFSEDFAVCSFFWKEQTAILLCNASLHSRNILLSLASKWHIGIKSGPGKIIEQGVKWIKTQERERGELQSEVYTNAKNRSNKTRILNLTFILL